MGGIYVFECEKCKYEARVAGGRDSGFLINTQTKICPDCRQLVDVVTGIIPGVYMTEKKKLELTEAKGSCPECGKRKFLLWKARACPKCGGKMKKACADPVLYWD